MGTTAIERLRRQIERRQVAFLVGAGVSMQVTGNTPTASWPGFARRGVELAIEGGDEAAREWGSLVLEEVEHDGYTRRLTIEDRILAALGGLGSARCARWVEETLGALPIEDPAPIEALAALGLPLLTFNFDNLVEDVTCLPSVTWRNPQRMQEVIAGTAEGVIHLHGHWRDPRSVVLGTRSHQQIEAVRAAHELVTSVSYTRTLVLVGFGAPLGALHFAPLRAWLSDSHEPRHFRLLRAGDEAEFQRDPEDRRHLRTITYGQRFEDLAPFLRGLAPRPDAHRSNGDRERRPWVRLLVATGAFGLALPSLDAFGLTGPLAFLTALASALAAGAVTERVLLHRWLRGRRPAFVVATCLTLAFLVAAIVSDRHAPETPAGRSEQTEPADGSNTGTSPEPQTTATTRTAPDAAPPQRPTTTGTATAPPPPPPATRSRMVEWETAPDTVRTLGLAITIGEFVLTRDDEDAVGRLVMQRGDARCPRSGSWTTIRSGDRFTMSTPSTRYRIAVDRVDRVYEYLQTTVTRTALDARRAAGVGCERR